MGLFYGGIHYRGLLCIIDIFCICCGLRLPRLTADIKGEEMSIQEDFLKLQQQVQEAAMKGDVATVQKLAAEITALQMQFMQGGTAAMRQAAAKQQAPAQTARPAAQATGQMPPLPKRNDGRPEDVWAAHMNPGVPAAGPVDSGRQITDGPLLKWADDKHVEFGSYMQGENGEVEKILWRVLENTSGQLLLLSEYVLAIRDWMDTISYAIPPTGKKEDIERARVPWEKTDVRRWLNNEFYNRAFHDGEKALVAERLNTGNGVYLHKDYKLIKCDNKNVNVLVEDEYATYEQRGAADTSDKVFFLSIGEAIQYFEKGYNPAKTKWWINYDRTAKLTPFLSKWGYLRNGKWESVFVENGKTWFGNEFKFFDQGEKLVGGVAWWLRSMGSNDIWHHAKSITYHHGQLSYVDKNGPIIGSGRAPGTLSNGIRPAILIKNSN